MLVKEFLVRKEEMSLVGKHLVQMARSNAVFLLKGNLGAGKTTLIQHILLELGLNETISSPTFSIVNTYTLPGGKTIHHFDLYRMETPEELEQIGFEEYLDGNSLSFIEWPEVGKRYYTRPFVEIELEHRKNQRLIRIKRVEE